MGMSQGVVVVTGAGGLGVAPMPLTPAKAGAQMDAEADPGNAEPLHSVPALEIWIPAFAGTTGGSPPRPLNSGLD
jgi:hypothetical protein